MANNTLERPRPASLQIIVPNRAIWEPEMFPKQKKAYNDTTRFRLLSGPRFCGKSRALLHTILKHAWGTENGRVAMFAKSIRNAKVGAWSNLTTFIMQEWLDAKLTSNKGGHRFDWTKEPGVDGSSRMHYFRIKNYYGGESEVQLHSLNCDADVFDKLLDTEFSMIAFIELQKFDDPDVFRVSTLQLRREGVPYHKHIWISDTNPPASGPDHFAYKMWFLDRVSEPAEDFTESEVAALRERQSKYGLHQFSIDDNIYADPKMIQDVQDAYRDDPAGWDRMVLGKWTKVLSSKEKHFHGIFKRELHVIGDVESPRQADWQILVPTKECTTLVTGWDLGHSCNHAFTLEEPMIMENDVMGFAQLDELVWIDIQEPLVDFILEACEKIESIEKLVGHKVEWRHWSDTSAWSFSATANVDAMLVYKLSEGKVSLLDASSAKEKHSVRRRVKLMQDLLKQGREIVSANCFHAISMYENIRSGKLQPDGTGEVIVKGSEEKHIFDAKSYLRFCELFTEVSHGPQKARTGPSIVSVPL